ncbi:MAG: 30S ribosomal protein S12 methylthiotransferase RimO [Candidatus Glassbacteria bacterium]|nr:30S ribosomal protein S12 methylthiotransferase RimO [Candidatus Glassbacteria bacterium]
MQTDAGRAIPVGLITLGCAKNEVDSEYMLADLRNGGFEPVEDLAVAEAVVVNTCAFIEPAREEAVETILEAARLKQTAACRVLAVVGCMAQRYRAELAESLPEVDIFIGVGADQRSLPDQLRGRLGIAAPASCDLPAVPRVVETAGQGWAYLKVSEGCSNRCSYCAIPLIRGSLASRTAGDIVEEARYLESLGVKELVLIAQDVTAWGADRQGSPAGLTGLLEDLLQETSVPWIRLLYTHPARLDEQVLRLIGAEDRIVPYLDMPVQHASDRMLERMGRGVNREEMIELVGMARRLVDNPVLRTTVMVGFPGEGRRDFEQLLEFIAQVRFDRLGAFVYSQEEGTRAADWPDSVPRAEKERRLEAVMELQRDISAELNQARVGRTVPVLVERQAAADEAPGGQYRWAGRSRAHAPEVDGQVFFTDSVDGENSISPGRIIPVSITESGDYDLFGAPAAG